MFYIWDKEMDCFQYCVFFQSKKDTNDYLLLKDSDYFDFLKQVYADDFTELKAGKEEEKAFICGFRNFIKRGVKDE